MGKVVERKRTKSVVRALLSARNGQLPEGVDVVSRANADLPVTPTATVAENLDRLLDTVLRRVAPQEGH